MTSNLIRNKRCVVVAPSGYLKGRGRLSKEFINSFDLVVKTTDMCEMEDSDGELGTRCDIWYGLPQSSSGWILNVNALKKQNVKQMRFQPCLPEYKETWSNYIDNFLQLNTGIPFEIASSDSYSRLSQNLGGIPFTGLFAIVDLLFEGASEVYAYGFDFYQSGYFVDIVIDYSAFKNSWHKPKQQMEFITNLLNNEPRFVCDENLKSILHKHKVDKIDTSLHQQVQAEFTYFNKLQLMGDVLLFRTCNSVSFQHIYESLIDVIPAQAVSIICQNQFDTNGYSNKTTIYRVNNQDHFTFDSLVNADFNQPVKTCIIPYNDLALSSYYHVFKYVESLGVNNVLLVSLRGTIKRIEDITLICKEINEYKEQEFRFKILQQKYDRKGAI